MRVQDISRTVEDERATIAATLRWEDDDRPDARVYFTTEARYAPHLTDTGNPFLAGSIMLALEHGERRLRVDAPTCPWLRDNLETAVAYFDRWFYGGERRLVLEPTEDAAPESGGARTGCFVSGGVDSAFALRHDRDVLGPEHPGRIRDAIVLRGFELHVDQKGSAEIFDHALRSLVPIATELDLDVVPVVTNLRQLDEGAFFWSNRFQGAILAATAHALAPRLSDVVIASSCELSALAPYGTHPAVDPNLGSHSLRIHHRGERFTRIDKVRRMKGWRTALDNLRVCSKPPPGRLNCGQCEKCLRVMLELLVVDELRHSPAFDACNVSAEMVDAVHVDGHAAPFYVELLPELHGVGRPDLSRAVRRKLFRDLPRRLQAHAEDTVKDLDRAFLQGRIRRRVMRWRGREGVR